MSKHQEIRERRRKQKQQQRMVFVLVAVGFSLIAIALIMLPFLRSTFGTVGDYVIPEPFTRPMVDRNASGDPEAPVVIINFSDYGCGHCGSFAETTALQISEDYVESGDVYYVSRSVGNLLGNPFSQLASEATYCAADQGKYWEYHAIVFANQISLFSTSTDISNQLVNFAEILELDMDTFNSCLANGDHTATTLQDGTDARSFGINSTPSFMINDTLVVGNVPYEEFQATIEAELAKSSD